jgi:hypothetical protein
MLPIQCLESTPETALEKDREWREQSAAVTPGFVTTRNNARCVNGETS